MTTTFDGLRNIIVRDFELPPERLARDTPLEQIELDSLAVTELVFALEDEFHVRAENAVPAFVTLGDIADYIDRLIAEREAGAHATPPPATEPGTDAKAPRKSARKSAAAKSGSETRARPRKRRGTTNARSDGRAR
jgi:acyl carrier protein